MKEILSLLVVVALISCSSPNNKFSDPVIQKIADFQDRRQTDSLIFYLLSRKADYREEAAMALASVQDTIASLQLGTTLLEDPSVEARMAAAFALGQTGGIAAANALIPALEDKESMVAAEALQALGKVSGKNDIESLTRFTAKDSVTLTGWAWGIYYLGVRGLADSVVTKRIATHLRSEDAHSVRLATAHFFNRASKIKADHFQKELSASAQHDKSVWVRMAATSSLRKIKNNQSIEVLKSLLTSEPDYRVRISAVRALGANQTPEAAATLIQAIDDKNPNVGIAASEVIKTTAGIKAALSAKAKASPHWLIQSNLYHSILTFAPSDSVAAEIKARYNASNNNYQRAALITALSSDPKQYTFIQQQLSAATVPVIKTSAAQALVNINYHKDFSTSLQQDFAAFYRQAVEQGDPGVIGIVAQAIADSSLHYKKVMTDYSFLTTAAQKLSLPKDVEALLPLQEAIAYLKGEPKPEKSKNTFNHPIAWGRLQSVTNEQHVIIKTTKGDITLKLLVEEAPGSVANFLNLIDKKYFDGKYFHRVVPNFVIQTGCNRGDGYGSEDYSIRSEFTRRKYKEGSVGMASAGKDTEGTQWFITHSPTPHLDGRYTIFAEVVSGMDIVHQIEIGDQIISASVVKN